MSDYKSAFTPLSKRAERRLSKAERRKYGSQLRVYHFHQTDRVKGLLWRDAIHTPLLGGLIVNRWLNRQSLAVIGDRRRKTTRPVVYCCTHIGRYDVEMAFEAIRSHCWIFMGDVSDLYDTFDGFILGVNGMIGLETDDADDRYVAKETAIRLLKQGGSLLIYPEGAWNVTPNQPVMRLYPGAVEMALRTGAEIVPVAIEQDGRSFWANIGENIYFIAYADKADDKATKRRLSDEVRQAMASLKWEIWAHRQLELLRRADLPANYAETFVQTIMAEGEPVNYTLDVALRSRYRSPDDPEEVWAHLGRLVPCRENAFLYNKRIMR